MTHIFFDCNVMIIPSCKLFFSMVSGFTDLFSCMPRGIFASLIGAKICRLTNLRYGVSFCQFPPNVSTSTLYADADRDHFLMENVAILA